MKNDARKELQKTIDGYSILYKNELQEDNTDSIHIQMETKQKEWAEKIYRRWYEQLLKLKKKKDENE